MRNRMITVLIVRNEVITAVRECETTGLRAVMMYGKRKVNGYSADIVIDVTCAPR